MIEQMIWVFLFCLFVCFLQPLSASPDNPLLFKVQLGGPSLSEHDVLSSHSCSHLPRHTHADRHNNTHAHSHSLFHLTPSEQHRLAWSLRADLYEAHVSIFSRWPTPLSITFIRTVAAVIQKTRTPAAHRRLQSHNQLHVGIFFLVFFFFFVSSTEAELPAHSQFLTSI